MEFEFFLAAELRTTVARAPVPPVTQADFVRWETYYARKAQRMEVGRG